MSSSFRKLPFPERGSLVYTSIYLFPVTIRPWMVSFNKDDFLSFVPRSLDISGLWAVDNYAEKWRRRNLGILVVLENSPTIMLILAWCMFLSLAIVSLMYIVIVVDCCILYMYVCIAKNTVRLERKGATQRNFSNTLKTGSMESLLKCQRQGSGPCSPALITFLI